MRRQALCLCKAQGSRGQRGEAFGARALHAHAFQEVIKAKAGGEPRRPAGWQNVVRAGDIVAKRFRRVVPQEHCAGMADLRQHGIGIGDSELDVLGRNAVGNKIFPNSIIRGNIKISFVITKYSS